VVIWALLHASGVQATIAGVAMGLLMSATARPGEAASPAERAEKLLRPVSAAVAVPLFALLSVGVAVSGTSGLWTSTVTCTSAQLSPELAWGDVAVIGLLGGIGFTVPCWWPDCPTLVHRT